MPKINRERLLEGKTDGLNLALCQALQANQIKVFDEIALKLDSAIKGGKRDGLDASYLNGVAEVRDRFQALANLVVSTG